MNWYCLVTTPQLEFQAECAIRQRGHEVVVPFEERELRAQYSRKLKVVPEPRFRKMPLFRQYALVQAAHPDDIGQLLYRMSLQPRRLVSNVLRYDGKYGPPSPLPRETTDPNGNRIDLLGYINDLSGRRIRNGCEIAPLNVDDVARITAEHAYSGQQSAIIGKGKGQTSKVLINILGAMRVVEIEDRYLRRVEFAPQIAHSA